MLKHRWHRVSLALATLAMTVGTGFACSSGDGTNAAQTVEVPPTPAHPVVQANATASGVLVAEPPVADGGLGGAPAPMASAPAPRFHLDDPGVAQHTVRDKSRTRSGRPIELVLRSSPPGAVAAVDGTAIGPTPALWTGSANGQPREFTFVLAGYAIARYRFVPTQSGIVHGSLSRLKTEPDPEPAK